MNYLDNISVKKLFSLKGNDFEAYNELLKNLNGKNTACGKVAKDIQQLSFASVSYLKEFIQAPTLKGFISVFELIFGISEAEFLKMKTTDFYYAFNWIQNELLELMENERLLESKPDYKWKEAGIEQLNIFGEMNTLIEIGKAYSVPPQEVENWSYNLVFTLAYHSKINSDINKKYSEIINRPNGNS